MIRSLHPLCSIFPRIPDDELQQLVDDIQLNGLREPIVLLDDQVLDGRNRYHACLEAGVQAQFRAFGSDKGDGTDPVAFVLSKNLRRRHLTPSQQAAAVAKAQDWSAAAAHGGKRRAEFQEATLPLETVADRAAAAGVGERTQKDADLVAKESPELLDKVISGEVSAHAAAKQIRADKAQTNSVGESRPAATEDSDSQSPAGAVPEDEEEPSRDEAMAELAFELDAYRIAAAGNEEAARRIIVLEGQIRTLESQRDEWMVKFNESLKQIKSLQKRLAKYERVAA